MSAPIELAMEEALRPGRYIFEHASFSVVNELESGRAGSRVRTTWHDRAIKAAVQSGA